MKSALGKMLPLALACTLAGLSVAHAADSAAKPDSVWQAYSVTVAPDQTMAFETGMKAWISCRHLHDSKDGFSAWEAQAGSDDYVFTTRSGPWSDMDVTDPGSKACDKTFGTDVMPHVKKMSSIVLVDLPDISYPSASAKSDEAPKYAEVTEYWLRAGHDDAFMASAKKYTAAAAKTKRDKHWTASRLVYGDKNAADVYIFGNASSWAELGSPAKTKSKAMLESVYGKAESKALRTQMVDAVKNAASNVYRYNAKLSFVPNKK